ncbi:hypothetical protein CAPN008_14220 [Capnocytophaga canis]|uniref:YopX family protein n=1 Tax=Capnocytophaga canis TaxID=1848903 RepID=UPI001AD38B5D|nr:YopX family protein [Capnocytophaga canis]GIM61372.1 hypothetical protein CAPN008_14220 [Capnocytophaga canis]
MQREIKFRAWDSKSQRMYYQGEPDLECVQSFFHHYNDNDELMQFTGLHDKNGKEIYEGDVIVFDLYSYWGHDIKEKGKIVFDDYAFVFKTKTGEYFLADLDCCKEEDIEIIGNIHETPKLLK